MKHSLWIASSVAAVALSAIVAGTGTVAGTRTTGLSGLQQVISSATVVDLATANSPCRVCFKDPSRCLHTCQGRLCPGGCN